MRFPDDVPVLSDGRITLRAHAPVDLEGVYEQCTDPLTQRFTTVPVPYSRHDAAQFLTSRAAAWESDNRWAFAIETPGGSGPARFGGSVSVSNAGAGIGVIAFGAHPDVRGRGVSTAAVQLVSSWAFTARGLHGIVWEAIEGDVASLRVAWKTGFTFEGPTRSFVLQRGEARSGWRGTLLASDDTQPKSRWLDPLSLVGPGVRLRELRLEDEDRYLETVNDRESMRWLGTIPFPRDSAAFRRQHARRWLESATGSSLEWAIADGGDDRYLGTVNLFGFQSLDYKSAEVGYRTHPDTRGRGVGKASLRLALGHAFGSEDDAGLGLERVSLNAGAGNLGSLGLARTCGFTETGRDRRCYDLDDGSVVDLIRFDLLKSEYDARH